MPFTRFRVGTRERLVSLLVAIIDGVACRSGISSSGPVSCSLCVAAPSGVTVFSLHVILALQEVVVVEQTLVELRVEASL